MNWNYRLFLCVSVVAGCGCTPAEFDVDRGLGSPVAESESRSSNAPEITPSQITNRFGMTFRLVSVDPSRPEHKDSYPKQSYFLQQEELSSGRQFTNFVEQTVERWEDRIEVQLPSSWQGFADFAKALSAADPDFDYRLPTQAEWAFACKNGYDQTCPKYVAGSTTGPREPLRPNKYGIEGFDNHDIECGDLPGVFFGQFYRYDWMYSQDAPECGCDHVTKGNPGSDDSLDELITGRFVLIPKSPMRTGGR